MRRGARKGEHLLRGLFVTGTDTNVGKTVVAAALLLRYRTAGYWKPIQTGTTVDDDTKTVRDLAALTPARVLDEGVRLPDPLSPHVAARRQGVRVAIEPLLALAEAQPAGRPWVVEGAGGVLVPVNETVLMVDLVRALQLPALVVARTTLGTINHTLLTLEALRSRQVPVAGVAMSGEPNADNRWSIEQYGGVPVLGVLPIVSPLDNRTLASHAGAIDPEGRLAELLQ